MNIVKVYGYFSSAVAVLREVKDLVVLLEEADTDDGVKHGEQKKQAVLDLLEVVYDTGDDFIDLPFSKEVLIDLASNAIEIFVKVFNILGQFRSKSQ